MIEQTGQAIDFYAFFVASKVGKTGLTVTVDVFRAGSLIVTAASATEVGDGLYRYTLSGASVTVEGEYTAVFKTADSTVDQQHVPSLWVVGRAGVENLDAAVSSRSSHSAADVWASGTRTLTSFGTLVADVATAVWAAGTRTLTAFGTLAADVWASATRTLTASSDPTAAAIADAVWDEALAGHATAGTAGAHLTAAGMAGDPLSSVVPGSYAQGTAGFALGRIGRARVDVTSPVSVSGIVELVRGDDYAEENGRALEFESSSWPDLTDASEIRITARRRPEAFAVGATDEVWFTATDKLTSRVVGGGTQVVVFELTASDTAPLAPSQSPTVRYAGKYDVQATVDGKIVTIAVGMVKVVEDQTR